LKLNLKISQSLGIISKLTDAPQKKPKCFHLGEGVSHISFKVLSGIKLKFVFIQRINVDARYQRFLVFWREGVQTEMEKKNRFWGIS
jgi:hypothetical protein